MGVAAILGKIKPKHVLYAFYIIVVLVLLTIVTWGLAGADCCAEDTKNNSVYCKVHGGHPAGSVGWSLLFIGVLLIGARPILKRVIKSKID